MASFGSDFYAFDDMDANLTFLEGDTDEARNLAYAVARRYLTPRGGNPFDPSYGYALMALVSTASNPSDAEISLAAEARKDERVADAKATVTVVGETWTIRIECTSITGIAFEFTLSVSQLTVALLKTGA